MKKLIKLIIYWLFPVSFVLLLTFSLNILISDFRFAHQSHMVYQNPYSWSKYYITLPIKKFFIDLVNNKQVGLPQTHLYISEKSKETLLNKTPKSTKRWVDGALLTDNGNIQKIQARYRGDNPRNWLFEKKSIRIKTRKKEMFERRRYFEYWPFNLQLFIPSNIANRMNVLGSEVKLIELFVNGKSNGIFIENERIDENFLRRNGIMPINLYKGENYNTESFVGIDSNLFNNPGLWSKNAVFNQRENDDKSDLKYFLSIAQSAETRNQDFKELLNNIDIDTWATFAAFNIIAQNYHNDYIHNIRIAIDPWNGHVYPIVVDPAFNKHYKPKKNPDDIFPLESSSNDLMTLLNRSSQFIDKKYEKLFNYTVKGTILSEEISNLENLREKINISAKRDPQINARDLLKDIDIYKSSIEKIEKTIINKFYSKPISSWGKANKNIHIYIEGELPISEVTINFTDEIPEWISLDKNYNGIVDDDEYKFFSNGEKYITMPARLYANRVSLSDAKTDMHTRSNITTGKTKFNIISEKEISPINIIATNPYSGKKFTLDNKHVNAVGANKFNEVIILKNIEKKLFKFSGEVYVENDFIIENPVKILPGTKFLITENSHIIFKNKVIAEGTSENPIVFKKKINTAKPWGTIALTGKRTAGSKFLNILMDGGSGGNYNQMLFTSMFSLHDTNDIKVENIKLNNHSNYDDMMHIIYCDNILINNAEFSNVFGDAIDVDLSRNVRIKNSKFVNAQNDSIDFMESVAIVESSNIIGSKDKGISIGENSNILIHNSIFEENNIAVAVKDKSIAEILHTNFENNTTQLSAYSKNWQYGGGGEIFVFRSYFSGDENLLNTSDESKLFVEDSSIVGKKSMVGKNVIISNVDYNDSKKLINKNNLKLNHPMFNKISLEKNKNRGYNLLN